MNIIIQKSGKTDQQYLFFNNFTYEAITSYNICIFVLILYYV